MLLPGKRARWAQPGPSGRSAAPHARAIGRATRAPRLAPWGCAQGGATSHSSPSLSSTRTPRRASTPVRKSTGDERHKAGGGGAGTWSHEGGADLALQLLHYAAQTRCTGSARRSTTGGGRSSWSCPRCWTASRRTTRSPSAPKCKSSCEQTACRGRPQQAQQQQRRGEARRGEGPATQALSLASEQQEGGVPPAEDQGGDHQPRVDSMVCRALLGGLLGGAAGTGRGGPSRASTPCTGGSWCACT